MKLEPHIIIESGRNTKTETMNTPWQKLQDKLVLDGRQSLIVNEIDATRCRSVSLKFSRLAQNRLDFAETVRQLTQQMSEPCRDSVTEVGDHTSKSEAPCQSVTALNVGETENSLTD